jgi:hypothetical protein
MKVQILKAATKRNLKLALKTKLRPVATMKLKRRVVGKMKAEEMVMVEMAAVAMEEMVEMATVVAMVEMAAVVDQNKMSKDDNQKMKLVGDDYDEENVYNMNELTSF